MFYGQQIMEEENLKVAERNNYKAVFTTNTNALTQVSY